MSEEQRKSLRVDFKKSVTINNSLKVQGIDISETGVYVFTGRHFPADTILNLTLPLDEETIFVKAKVQHSQAGVGMGLMFVDLDPDDRAAIRGFIADAGEAKGPAKKKILLVEDNATQRLMEKSRLVMDGYSVVEARDGIEAIGLIEKESFDIVVLDLYLERLDGYKVLSAIRQKPELRGLPVLVLSGRATPEEMRRAKAAGATEFLVKMTTSPVKLSELVKKYLKN